ncbi:MAG: GntR family transcriptional regulator [Acidimicrobiales bacterium]
MTTRPLSVDDVHRALLGRISGGGFAVGSRLPSCRALARELGSNPSTVDRAIQRLAEAGLVRTSPRRGTYVAATEPPHLDVVGSLTDDMDRLVARAAASGLPIDEIKQRFEDALHRARRQPAVVFVECNPHDLDRMAGLVENATGITMDRMLLSAAGRRLDRRYDVVAVPLFHLADLADHVTGLDSIVEINFVASPAVLRRLATLRAEQRVVIAAPSQRVFNRVSVFVRHYYPDEVERFLIGIDPVEGLAGADVVVRSHASKLPRAAEALVHDEVVIEWELDPAFASAFRARVDMLIRRRRP